MSFSTAPQNKPLTASFYKDLKFSDDAVVITSMLESSFGKEIRITFKEGQVMKEHKTKFPITVMTLQGCIEFTVNGETSVLKEGDIIALEGGIIHELKAIQESIVWLGLHKADSIERVESVLKM
ncbi:MAG: cupin [Sulfurovum sp.]|nr:cupin [Sulfurovum sp.]